MSSFVDFWVAGVLGFSE